MKNMKEKNLIPKNIYETINDLNISASEKDDLKNDISLLLEDGMTKKSIIYVLGMLFNNDIINKAKRAGVSFTEFFDSILTYLGSYSNNTNIAKPIDLEEKLNFLSSDKEESEMDYFISEEDKIIRTREI